MLFSAPVFLFLFLPVVLLAYTLVPQRFRNAVLTVASLVFYAAGDVVFTPILLGSILLNYYFARWMAASVNRRRARLLLWLGIASDLGLLLYFKYANFLGANFESLRKLVHPSAEAWAMAPVVLPLGISFFTFHKISYKVDVYRGHTEAKKNPLELALYILLFPQLIAGPIVRYNEIAGQLGSAARRLEWDRFVRGVRIFIIGLSKKMLIANFVALPADQIFALNPHLLSPGTAWLGAVCYMLQIYFDFSGYSDMALGMACWFGFDFPRNFNRPYAATSITDFWRRWHISLSTWFRDYVYIPLGGNRGGRWRTNFNLITVFLLCGFWHGASWTFVVWGLYHGLFLMLERRFLARAASGRFAAWRHIYVLVVVLVGWVFFRAASLPQALQYLGALAGLNRVDAALYPATLFLDWHVAAALLVGCLTAVPLPRWLVTLITPGAGPAVSFWRTEALPVAGLVVCLGLALLEVVAGTYNPFIYYNF